MLLYRLSTYFSGAFVALLAAVVGVSSLAHADRITVNGTTYEEVYVTQTTSLYFVRFPETGETRSYSADQVTPNSFRESDDREELRALWRERAQINPQQLLEERDAEYQGRAPDKPEEPKPLGKKTSYESQVSREDRAEGVEQRERFVERDGTPTLVLKGNKKADRSVDVAIQRYMQEQQRLQQQQEQEWMAYQQEMQEAQTQAEMEAREAAYQEYLRGLNLSQQELQQREQALRVDAMSMQNDWMRRFGRPYNGTPYWPRVPVFVQPRDNSNQDNTSGGARHGSQYNNHGGNYNTQQQMDRLETSNRQNNYPRSQDSSGGNRHQSLSRNTYPWSATPTEPSEEENE